IRVWAGDRGSASADSNWWMNVVEDSRRIADMASEEGITISFEFHANTLTDTSESAVKLLQLCDHDNIKTLWQKSVNWSETECEESLAQVSPWLTNVHVFQLDNREKLPLRSGFEEWQHYFTKVAA